MKTQALPEWAVKIKALRKKLNETQEQFARRFGVTQVAVAYWEMGRNDPPAAVVIMAMKEIR